MDKKIDKKNNRAGFTLIELMVVVVILGILAGMLVPKLMGRTDQAKATKAKVDITSLETALKLFRLDNGRYPSTSEGLQALITSPENDTGYNQGGYLEKGNVPKDPWGNEYLYLCPGSHGEFDLSSYGADGVAGGTGKNRDINNWEIN